MNFQDLTIRLRYYKFHQYIDFHQHIHHHSTLQNTRNDCLKNYYFLNLKSEQYLLLKEFHHRRYYLCQINAIKLNHIFPGRPECQLLLHIVVNLSGYMMLKTTCLYLPYFSVNRDISEANFSR